MFVPSTTAFCGSTTDTEVLQFQVSVHQETVLGTSGDLAFALLLLLLHLWTSVVGFFDMQRYLMQNVHQCALLGMQLMLICRSPISARHVLSWRSLHRLSQHKQRLSCLRSWAAGLATMGTHAYV